MFSTAVVLSMADASLGRPDPHYFSDQMRMELLVTSILESKTRNSKTLPPFYDAQGDFLDACQWSGISCDHDANVTAINWQLCTWLQYAQTFFFEYAPPNIRTLEISYNEFSCTVDFTPLGENLTDLYVGRNRFHGETKTADIPRAVAYLWLEYNNFSRSIALERLPPGLITFYAGHNAYSVTVRLDNLPPMLENLYLMYNKLLGPCASRICRHRSRTPICRETLLI